MKIEVLGTGCAGCRALYETVRQATEELEANADITKQEDIAKIIEYGVMSLPALVVDGEVVSKGRRLSLAEVREILAGRI